MEKENKIGYKTVVLALLLIYAAGVILYSLLIRPPVDFIAGVSSGQSSSVTAVEQKININTATAEQLITLNGIGATKAAAIINYRTEHGNFEHIEDIMQVSGIGQATFDKIKDDICVK